MGMLYEYDEVEPLNERERRALASEGRQGVSETVTEAFLKWWDGQDSEWTGWTGLKEAAASGFDAALEWAAGRMERQSCACAELATSGYAARALSGESPHLPLCPIFQAAKIREGAP